MTKLHRSIALASAVVVGVAACSTGGGDGSSRFASPTGPSAAVIAVTRTAQVCKIGPVGTYDFSASATGNDNAGDDFPGTSFSIAVTVANQPTCVTVFTRINAETDQNGADAPAVIGVTELAHTGTTLQSVVATLDGAQPTGISGATATMYVNGFHDAVTTYTNIPVHVAGCTYTKGWYQNKNGAPTIVLTLDGRTPNEQRAIFAATPGQPGSVTWGTNNKPNNLLNLYQQLLAALNNGGAAGPQSVQDAIAAALAATGGSGLNITVVGSPDIGALITPLSNFNEGLVAGFPHCGDEVIVH